MRFAQIDDDGSYLIEAYDSEHIRISGRDYRAGIAVSAGRIVTDWGPARIDDLEAGHLAPLLDAEPQVVVIGTGPRQRFPDPTVYFALLERGIGVEFMDTGAACRTYNILVSEGRRVVAALILD